MIVGVGVDIVDLARIRDVLERHRDRFLDRILTAEEKRYCLEHRDPTPFVAARFAAKEAVFKAIGTGWSDGVRWTDIEVRRDAAGRPLLVTSGMVQQLEGAGARWHLSMSHERSAAVAVAVLERDA